MKHQINKEKLFFSLKWPKFAIASRSSKKTEKSASTRLFEEVSYEESNLQGETIFHLKSQPHLPI